MIKSNKMEIYKLESSKLDKVLGGQATPGGSGQGPTQDLKNASFTYSSDNSSNSGTTYTNVNVYDACSATCVSVPPTTIPTLFIKK